MTKRERVMELLKEGMKPREIVRKLKCSISLVYYVKKQIREVKPTLRKDIVWYGLKSADPWRGGQNPDDVMMQMPCAACHQEMWTASEKHDLCENCMWQYMQDSAEALLRRENQQYMSPTLVRNSNDPIGVID